jgi:hypothetical protein
MLMPTLDCKRVTFYSPADEAAFFRFAESIKAVRRIEAVRDSLVLHVASRLSHASLRDLLALFERYRISQMSQLAQFLSSSNRGWFADPKKSWHKKVFTDATRRI